MNFLDGRATSAISVALNEKRLKDLYEIIIMSVKTITSETGPTILSQTAMFSLIKEKEKFVILFNHFHFVIYQF